MRYAVTGHRPVKLGGYAPEAQDILYRFAVRVLSEYDPDEVISGMALGWDTAIARAAIYLAVPLVAAVPFVGQEEAWPAASQRTYNELLSRAEHVEVITSGGYSPQAMQLRNEWMVDHCDILLALWDGSAGGTGNCVRYANRFARVECIDLWARWREFQRWQEFQKNYLTTITRTG